MDAATLTDLDPSTWTPEEIKRRTEATAEAEPGKYGFAPDPEPEPEQGNGGNDHDREQADHQAQRFSSKFVFSCLYSKEDGDATLFIELHRGLFCFDTAAGSWFKWAENYWTEDHLNEAMAAVESVISVYGETAQREAWQRLQAEKGTV
jgi:hypothetical protein